MTNDEILARLHRLLDQYQSHLLTVGELSLAVDFHLSSLSDLAPATVLGLREHMERVQQADHWTGAPGDDTQRLVAALADFRGALERIGGAAA